MKDEDSGVKQEARDALATAFEGVGGMSKFIAWAKTHRSAFYSMYVKLLPMQVQTKVDVTHHDADEALHNLLDAFKRGFESRREDKAREEAAGIFRDDEGALIERGTEQYRLLQARYELDQRIEQARGGGRLPNDAERAPLEQVTYTRVDDPSPVDAGCAILGSECGSVDGGPSAVDARRGTDDTRRGTPANDPPSTVDVSKQNPNLEHDGSLQQRGLRPSATVRAHPVTAEPSSTELYYRWMEGPGGGRHRWGPI